MKTEEKTLIKEAKELIEELKDIKIGYPDVSNMVDLFQSKDKLYQDFDFWEFMDNQGIISYDNLENIAKESDLARMAYLLSDIEYPQAEYFYMDGYGNASDLDTDTIKDAIDELIDELENKYLDN